MRFFAISLLFAVRMCTVKVCGVQTASIITAILLAFFGIIQFGFAQEAHIIRLSDETQSLTIGREMEFFEDKTGVLTFDQIRHDSSLVWKKVQSEKPSYGFTRSVYWFRFRVQFSSTKNTVTSRNNWLLELDYPPLDSVTFYTISSNAAQPLSIYLTGDLMPFRERQFPHRSYILDINAGDTSVQTYFVRIATQSSLQVPITLYSRNAFIHANTEIDVFYGAIFGTMLTLLALNIVLYFTMQTASYLLFVVYLGATSWYYAATAGYAQFLVGNFPTLLNVSTLVALFLTFGSLSLFGRLFLQASKYSPRLDRIHFLAGITGLIGAAAVIVIPYRMGVSAGSAMVLVVTLMCFVSGVVILRRGNRSAAYFLVALAAFFVGSMTTLFRNLGIVPSNAFTVHSVEIASAIEGVLFSFGLAGQYRLLKKQKEIAQLQALQLQQEANMRLEEKVKQRTQALAESNEEIQRQLTILDEQSREIEIANTTLQEKNLQLEELNREKNEFLGIAAHDLKNPLSSITMSASIVLSYRDKITKEQLDERLQNIVGTAGRMMEIIKNLLDVNAIESGQFNFTVEQVNIAEITYTLVKEYQERAAVKNITLHYEQNAVITQVMGDRSALMEAIENLISNAVKYSPHGKNIYVRIQEESLGAMLREQNDEDNREPSSLNHQISSFLQVRVSDEGPGISEEDKKKLFGKFVRLSARPTGGEHSTGLGLSIVKKMVEAMHGKVWCESELGKGATFVIELPISAP